MQAAELAGEGGTVVVNGDLFDDRAKLDIDVIDGMVKTVTAISRVCRVILSPGNHDQFLRDGRIHSLGMFEGLDNVIVVPQEGGHYPTSDCWVHIYPFNEDLGAVKAFVQAEVAWVEDSRTKGSKHHVLVLHEPVQAAVLGNGEVDSTGLPVTSLRPDVFDYVLLGHYHKPQKVGADNVMYIGSPYQVKSDERGDLKRFLVFGDSKMESVPVTGMPRYIYVNSLEEAVQFPDDFVDLVCEPAVIQNADLPTNVVFAGAPDKPRAEVVGETAILDNFDVATAVQVWINNQVEDPERAKRLTALAHSRMPS